MPFRLFIDLEAIEFLQSGRMLNVSLFAGLAISYWIDDADGHVKIMKIEPRMGI
jgi:hypothetical protein